MNAAYGAKWRANRKTSAWRARREGKAVGKGNRWSQITSKYGFGGVVPSATASNYHYHHYNHKYVFPLPVVQAPPVPVPEPDLVFGPVRSYRSWLPRFDGDRPVLASTGVPGSWPGVEMVATHNGSRPSGKPAVHPDDAVPVAGCTCGIYSCETPELVPDRIDMCGMQAHIYGALDLTGKVVKHRLGYRAQRARIVHLFDSTPDAARFAEFYEVPLVPTPPALRAKLAQPHCENCSPDLWAQRACDLLLQQVGVTTEGAVVRLNMPHSVDDWVEVRAEPRVVAVPPPIDTWSLDEEPSPILSVSYRHVVRFSMRRSVDGGVSWSEWSVFREEQVESSPHPVKGMSWSGTKVETYANPSITWHHPY